MCSSIGLNSTIVFIDIFKKAKPFLPVYWRRQSMNISKSCLVLAGIVALLLSSCIVSASTIDDQPNDVIHHKWSDINNWYYEWAVDEKPSIDIDSMSLEIVGGQALFKMTLYGDVMTDELYHYMGTYNSDEATYFFMYSSSPDGEDASFGTWSVGTGAGPATSVVASGKEITATFDSGVEGTTNVDFWGVATEYSVYGDELVEHWVDYAPDDKFEGDILGTGDDDDDDTTGDDDDTTGDDDDDDDNNVGGGSGTPGTPGFETIAVLIALGAAFIILRRRK